MGMSTSICKYGRASYDLGVRLSLAFVRFDIYIYIYIYLFDIKILKKIFRCIFLNKNILIHTSTDELLNMMPLAARIVQVKIYIYIY
jgi:hypothetical protein